MASLPAQSAGCVQGSSVQACDIAAPCAPALGTAQRRLVGFVTDVLGQHLPQTLAGTDMPCQEGSVAAGWFVSQNTASGSCGAFIVCSCLVLLPGDRSHPGVTLKSLQASEGAPFQAENESLRISPSKAVTRALSCSGGSGLCNQLHPTPEKKKRGLHPPRFDGREGELLLGHSNRWRKDP